MNQLNGFQIGAIAGGVIVLFFLGMLFGMTVGSKTSREICVPPAMILPAEWQIGDCVAMDLVKGNPTKGWYRLMGKYDDGSWQAMRVAQDGTDSFVSSISYKPLYTRIACPKHLKLETPTYRFLE